MTVVQGASDVAPAPTGGAPRLQSITAPSRRALKARTALVGLTAMVDAACLAAAIWAARLFSSGAGAEPYAAAVAFGLWLTVFAAFGLYSTTRADPVDELRRLTGACLLGILAMAFFVPGFSPSGRPGVFLALVLTPCVEAVARAGLHILTTRMKRDGLLAKRALIIGANAEAAGMADALADAESGFDPVGYVATYGVDPVLDGIPVMGGFEELDDIVLETGVEALIVAASSVKPSQARTIMKIARKRRLDVLISTALPPLLRSRLDVQAISGESVLAVRTPRLSRGQIALKRGFDVTVAGMGLVLAAPLLLVIAAAIRLSSRGQVFYRQKRVTEGDRVFEMLKFRTMVKDADREVDGTVPFFKLERDPRQTPVGKVLRRLSLDELPQLINVLKGDMSIVGPRPLPAEQIRANTHKLEGRHEVKAGLTGWWQVNGRSRIEAEEAVEMDLFYIENWSIWLDLYVCARTFTAVFRGGAY